jgi:glycosyltransferase involved in cell wall biosynthesis
MPPFISVILPVYNQEKYLEETLQSILDQTYRNFELLIIDDGSTDNSAQIIQKFQSKDARITAFYEKNSGKSNCTNRLVNLSVGEFCVFLDADDVMYANRIERQVKFHQENPLADASSCDCDYINEKGIKFGTQRYPGLSSIEECNQARHCQLYIMCSFTGLIVKRKVFIDVGGLSLKFKVCEDFEFFNRLMDHGYNLLILSEVLMKYRIHSSAITVREPVYVTSYINFTTHCILQRRKGEKEFTFEQFKTMENEKPIFQKLNNMRYNYSMIYFRNAGLAFLSKRYHAFVPQIIASMVLSPNYFVNKVKNYLKK